MTNPVMRSLVTWTPQVALHAFYPSIHSARGNMPAEELGALFKSNVLLQVNSPSLHCISLFQFTFPSCLFLKIP